MNALFNIIIIIMLMQNLDAQSERAKASVGALREKVSVDINASSVEEAVKQLIEQGGRENKSIEYFTIQVDPRFPKKNIVLKMKDAPVSAVLLRIAGLTAGRLNIDEDRRGYSLQKVVEVDGDSEKEYFLSKDIIDRMAIKLTSKEDVQRRLEELGVQLQILEVNADSSMFVAKGSEFQMKSFEILTLAISTTGISFPDKK